MIVWPDQWYHTSGDTPDKSDATQLKRVVTISAAAADFLAGAGPAEVERMMAEISARAGRADRRARRPGPSGCSCDADAKTVSRRLPRRPGYIVDQAFRPGKGGPGLDPLLHRRDDAGRRLCSRPQLAGLRRGPGRQLKGVDELYAAALRGARTSRPAKDRPDEGRDPAGRARPRADREDGRPDRHVEAAATSPARVSGRPGLHPGMAERELRNFIDGKRSILRHPRRRLGRPAGRSTSSTSRNGSGVLEKAGFVTDQEDLGGGLLFT